MWLFVWLTMLLFGYKTLSTNNQFYRIKHTISNFGHFLLWVIYLFPFMSKPWKLLTKVLITFVEKICSKRTFALILCNESKENIPEIYRQKRCKWLEMSDLQVSLRFLTPASCCFVDKKQMFIEIRTIKKMVVNNC